MCPLSADELKQVMDIVKAANLFTDPRSEHFLEVHEQLLGSRKVKNKAVVYVGLGAPSSSHGKGGGARVLKVGVTGNFCERVESYAEECRAKGGEPPLALYPVVPLAAFPEEDWAAIAKIALRQTDAEETSAEGAAARRRATMREVIFGTELCGHYGPRKIATAQAIEAAVAAELGVSGLHLEAMQVTMSLDRFDDDVQRAATLAGDLRAQLGEVSFGAQMGEVSFFFPADICTRRYLSFFPRIYVASAPPSLTLCGATRTDSPPLFSISLKRNQREEKLEKARNPRNPRDRKNDPPASPASRRRPVLSAAAAGPTFPPPPSLP